MATGQQDGEYKSEQASDDDLVLTQLGHRDVQYLAGIGLRGVERDSLDGSLCLHGSQRLFAMAWKEVRLHSHSIYLCFQNLIYTMAKGGYDPTETTEKTPLIPDTGDDDDDDDMNNMGLSQYQVTEEGNIERILTPGGTDTTQPFEPGAASTPAGEHIPMATRLPQEQQGPSTAETSFIIGDTQGQRVRTMQENMAWREVSEEFPLADRNKLDVQYKVAPRAGGGGGGAIIEVKMSGKDKWYRLYTQSRGLPESLSTSLFQKRSKTLSENH